LLLPKEFDITPSKIQRGVRAWKKGRDVGQIGRPTLLSHEEEEEETEVEMEEEAEQEGEEDTEVDSDGKVMEGCDDEMIETGDRVEVYWRGDDQWYSGVVVGVTTEGYHVVYDDGDKGREKPCRVRKEGWQQRKRRAEIQAVPEPGSKRHRVQRRSSSFLYEE
jgi:hypothetical protein